MSWLSYLFPKILARYSSKYNRDIRVVLDSNKLKLLVNGSRQSGASIEQMYGKAFRHFGIDAMGNPKHILMLGFGGGSAIHMLKKLYPDVSIDAVDIDPTIVEIGNKYFGLDKVKDLKIYIDDAFAFITKKYRSSYAYDLIFVDLFIGNQIPDFVTEKKFISSLKQKLIRDGKVLINYSNVGNYKQKSKVILRLLSDNFRDVSSLVLLDNMVLFAR